MSLDDELPQGDGVLSPRQREALAAMDCLIREHQYPPTRRELLEEMGDNPNHTSWANHLVRALARKGFIRLAPREARAMEIIRRRDGRFLLHRGEWYEFIPVDALGG